MGYVLRYDSLLHDITEGRMKGKPTRGRRLRMLCDPTKGNGMEIQWNNTTNMLYSRRPKKNTILQMFKVNNCS